MDNEKQLENKLKTDFLIQEPLGIFKKIHGNMYQKSMPDLLMSNTNSVSMVELKFERSRKSVSVSDIMITKLSDTQLQFLTKLTVVKGPILPIVLLGIPFRAIDGFAAISTHFDNIKNIKYTPQKLEKYILGSGNCISKPVLMDDGSRVQAIIDNRKKLNVSYLCFLLDNKQ